jgi:putative ABC transport system permease protein
MQIGQIISTSIIQSFQELRVNKLRTFLSLLGITIGIFCIIAVLTVIDSMKNNIRNEMSSLGNDVLYIGRWPWMDEGGEYKWWEFWRRKSMSLEEYHAIEHDVADVDYLTLCLPLDGNTIKYQSEEATGISCYAVMHHFDKLQNIEIQFGRYLSAPEIDGGVQTAVIGYTLYQNLFPGNIDAIGKHISLKGKAFTIVGVMKKVGKNMAGFDYDNSLIFSYYIATTMVDTRSFNVDPFLMVKAQNGKSLEDVKDEVTGVLRRVRKVKPGQHNDFAINQLSQISERIEMLFTTINLIGWVIAGFSLIVGGFGIANIMFVTVKERTKIIGLKKAIGARSGSILLEFLLEAVSLCLIGGLVGVLIVLLLSFAMTHYFDFPVVLSTKNFIVGLSISAIVGILAGFIPARAASKLDPVVAIRTQ